MRTDHSRARQPRSIAFRRQPVACVLKTQPVPARHVRAIDPEPHGVRRDLLGDRLLYVALVEIAGAAGTYPRPLQDAPVLHMKGDTKEPTVAGIRHVDGSEVQ